MKGEIEHRKLHMIMNLKYASLALVLIREHSIVFNAQLKTNESAIL